MTYSAVKHHAPAVPPSPLGVRSRRSRLHHNHRPRGPACQVSFRGCEVCGSSLRSRSPVAATAVCRQSDAGEAVGIMAGRGGHSQWHSGQHVSSCRQAVAHALVDRSWVLARFRRGDDTSLGARMVHFTSVRAYRAKKWYGVAAPLPTNYSDSDCDSRTVVRLATAPFPPHGGAVSLIKMMMTFTPEQPADKNQ